MPAAHFDWRVFCFGRLDALQLEVFTICVVYCTVVPWMMLVGVLALFTGYLSDRYCQAFLPSSHDCAMCAVHRVSFRPVPLSDRNSMHS